MHTQRYVAQTQGAKLVILENDQIRCCSLDVRPTWLIGRYDPTRTNNVPDITFSSMIVSREHGWLHNIEDQWFFTDNPNNLNGTFYNGKKMARPMPGKKKSVMLSDGDILRIDSEDLNHASKDGVLMLFTTANVTGAWTAYSLAGHAETTIGSDAACDITEPLPHLSAKHAAITYLNGQYYLSDCGSTAGTYLNGIKVERSIPLREKDCISLCNRKYFFLGDKLLSPRPGKRNSP